jgi:hypothetical protein
MHQDQFLQFDLERRQIVHTPCKSCNLMNTCIRLSYCNLLQFDLLQALSPVHHVVWDMVFQAIRQLSALGIASPTTTQLQGCRVQIVLDPPR